MRKIFSWHRIKRLSLKASLGVMLTASCVLTVPAYAEEEEDELSPSFFTCLSNATATADINKCAQDAYDYWNNQVEPTYQSALTYCKDFSQSEGDEVAQQCLARVISAQNNWKTYQEHMKTVFSYTSANRGGTAEAFDVLYNMALITRNHVLMMAPPQFE